MRKEGISGQALKDRMVSDPDFYVQFQCDIVQEHCKQEQAQEEEDCLVLSDRSVLDTIPFVHEYLLEERRGDAEARIRKLEEFQECLQRYRLPTSMVVLVHPFAAEAPADGTRLIPKDGSGAAFTKRLRQLLQDEHIAYVDLVETDRKGRVREILKELEALCFLTQEPKAQFHKRASTQGLSSCQGQPQVQHVESETCQRDFFMHSRVVRHLRPSPQATKSGLRSEHKLRTENTNHSDPLNVVVHEGFTQLHWHSD
eukprot:6473849-Amphidinium_carterae.1